MASKRCLKVYRRKLKASHLSVRTVGAAYAARAKIKEWDKQYPIWPRQTGKTTIVTNLVLTAALLARHIVSPSGRKKVALHSKGPTLNKEKRGRSHYKFKTGLWEQERHVEQELKRWNHEQNLRLKQNLGKVTVFH